MTADIEKLKGISKTSKLYSVNFVDQAGNLSKKQKNVTHVELRFTSGDEFKITFEEFCGLGDLKFTLGNIGDA